MDPLTAITNCVSTVIDKIFPDKDAADRAKLEMLKLQQDGAFKDAEMAMSAVIAEAKSSDPWTSRARPSFLYVIYCMILAAIPMGVLSAFSADTARQVADGMKLWLAAIPNELWAVFGVGYTGYTVARSAWDKKAIK